MTVDELLHRVSSAELTEWAAWARLRAWENEKPGQRRDASALYVETIGGHGKVEP